MAVDSQVPWTMLLHIAEFFRYMSDNAELRLYYVLPIRQNAPYAYQHSSIRDVATICDILDLVQFFKERELSLAPDALALFENVTRNTLQAYHNLYQRDALPNFPEGNIGDIGFFLFALQKCLDVYPSQLPNHWKETLTRQTVRLLDRQQADGSISIYFDTRLKDFEKSAEAFYLPEALIGLIASVGNNTKEIEIRAIAQVKKAITYCCQEKIREQNLATDSATFYANWQFQLLYHWIQKKLPDERVDPLEANHLQKLINSLKESGISAVHFGNNVATVEVACYFEGLVHAQRTLEMLNMSTSMHDDWFEKEIDRCLRFLYEIQMVHLNAIHGGFVHSYDSHEARIDVAGHVFGGLRLLFSKL